jgi:hypothetical protein
MRKIENIGKITLRYFYTNMNQLCTCDHNGIDYFWLLKNQLEFLLGWYDRLQFVTSSDQFKIYNIYND